MDRKIPPYWQAAIAELSQVDAVMAKIIARYPNEAMESKEDAFHTLMRSITGQQISVKAADSVWGRLQDHLSLWERSKDAPQLLGEGASNPPLDSEQARHSIPPHPKPEIPTSSRGRGVETVALLPDETLRACGYSRQKISYIRSLCEFFLSRQHLERDWSQMEDEAVIADITQIRGIGRWTAEMFLMFHLLRPNILPLDDIGLLNAIDKHYPSGTKRKKADYRMLGENWQPWRSVATWYLWRGYDDDPVGY